MCLNVFELCPDGIEGFIQGSEDMRSAVWRIILAGIWRTGLFLFVFLAVFGIDPRALTMRVKCSTT
jgi:hypothetical protein